MLGQWIIMSWIKSRILGLTAFAMLVGVATISQAATCAARANEIAARNGGRVLAVKTITRGPAVRCRITLLVKSRDGGPPRKKTIIVRK